MRCTNRGFSAIVLIAVAAGTPLEAAAQEQPRGTERRVEARTIPRTLEARTLPRGWFGFGYSPVTENGTRQERVAVVQVAPNSGAARGGLQSGDTIVRWANRTDVHTALQEMRAEPDQSVRLRARKNGRERDLTIVAGTRPNVIVRGEDGRTYFINPGVPGREFRVFADSMLPHLESLGIHADSLHRRLQIVLRDSLGPRLRELERLRGMNFELRSDSTFGRGPLIFDFETGMRGVAGAEFTELNPELSSYFGTDRGVLVLRVAPDTPAARAGLQAGDVVRRVNGQDVRQVRDIRTAVSRARDRTVEMDVVRRGSARTVRMSWE
jgi:predicted metalloprotease with PDZ domain